MAIPYDLTSSESVRQKAEREIIWALDHAPFTRRHAIFVAAVLASLFFDYGKPITISFVLPGMTEMFGLTPATAAYLPIAGLTGTTLGALFWGYISDRIGRRQTLLWTIGIFSVASLCGLAIHYWHSLLACLIMGLGVGAEVPSVLAAEFVPARYRSRTLLFLGIIGWLGGYTIAAGLAAIFKSFFPETFAWRLLWLVNVLPGLLILWLRTRVIPESPRFLLHHGRIEEARAAAEALVGPILAHQPHHLGEEASQSAVTMAPLSKFYGRTLIVSFFSLAVGLATFGFIIWLPTLLGRMGYTGSGSSANLALSSLIALPALAITLPVLSRLGARRTLIVYSLCAGLALLSLGLGAAIGLLTPPILVVITTAVFLFLTSIGALLTLYAAEIFPTAFRGRLSGTVAAFGRVGAVTGPYLVGLWLTRGGSMSSLQLALASLLGVAAIIMLMLRVETQGRTLEQIGVAVAAD